MGPGPLVRFLALGTALAFPLADPPSHVQDAHSDQRSARGDAEISLFLHPCFALTILAMAFLWVLLKDPSPSRWDWEQIIAVAFILVPGAVI